MPDDFAILVGVSCYSDGSLRPLDGPLNDVALMERWLRDPEGGGLTKPDQIQTIISDPGDPSARPMPPLVQDFEDALMKIVRQPSTEEWIRRDGRLYLYFSGHGFSERSTDNSHAALYAGNCAVRAGMHYNIHGTFFARWAKSHGLFREIVLIMDCCRDAETTKVASIPPLAMSRDPALSNAVRLLEIYAAPRGGQAQERQISGRNSQVYGLLTHALIEALETAPTASGLLSGAALKSHLEETWTQLCGDSPVNPPEVLVPGQGDILFKSGKQKLLQGFLVAPLGEAWTLTVGDGTGAPAIAKVVFKDGKALQDGIAGASPTPLPIVDGVLRVPLIAGLYLAACVSALGSKTKAFQTGVADVSF